MRHVTTADYGTEVVLTVDQDDTGTSYVRVCDPEGFEVAYWNEDEWRETPAEVMGAVIGALCAIERGDPNRANSIGKTP